MKTVYRVYTLRDGHNIVKKIHGKRKTLGGDIIQVTKFAIVLMLEDGIFQLTLLSFNQAREGSFNFFSIKTIKLSIE